MFLKWRHQVSAIRFYGHTCPLGYLNAMGFGHFCPSMSTQMAARSPSSHHDKTTSRLFFWNRSEHIVGTAFMSTTDRRAPTTLQLPSSLGWLAQHCTQQITSVPACFCQATPVLTSQHSYRDSSPTCLLAVTFCQGDESWAGCSENSRCKSNHVLHPLRMWQLTKELQTRPPFPTGSWSV